MEEKIYTTKRKGMAVLLTVLFVYLIAITGTVFGAVKYEDSAETGYLVLMVVSIVVLSLGWFPLIGLRVLKPQEALVLTLFGKYVGTIREAGFYFVNPFVQPSIRQLLQSWHRVGISSRQQRRVHFPSLRMVHLYRSMVLHQERRFH